MRLPFPIPALAGYLVDKEGQVWRAGGANDGGDLPIRMLTRREMLAQTVERKMFLSSKPMPGVWWFPEPNRNQDRITRELREKVKADDSMYRGRVPKPEGARLWTIIDHVEGTRDVVLVYGPDAYAAIASEATLTTE